MGIKNVGNPDASFRARFDQTTDGVPVPAAPPAVPDPPSPAPISVTQTGYTFSGDGYTYHAFPNVGSFTVDSGGPMEIEYFLVGGGGGGSDRGNGTGGGGAGGVLTNMPLGTPTPDAGHARVGNPRFIVSPGPYTIKIGGGGVGGSDNTACQGEPTEFYSTPLGPNHPDGLQAFGGGYGGYSAAGGIGGCGGGADNNNKSDYNPVTGDRGRAIYYPGDNAQGFPGGSDGGTPGNGGGGGAGGAGENGKSGNVGSYGGIGVKAPWCPSSYGQPGPSPGRWFAGGGGGGIGAPGPAGTGGGPGGPYAGGGNGAIQNGGNAGDGAANSGGGGGSGCDGNTAGGGGSGIVIIRYQN